MKKNGLRLNGENLVEAYANENKMFRRFSGVAAERVGNIDEIDERSLNVIENKRRRF
jgi:hypothetical protein